jgi:hypothetical protein
MSDTCLIITDTSLIFTRHDTGRYANDACDKYDNNPKVNKNLKTAYYTNAQYSRYIIKNHCVFKLPYVHVVATENIPAHCEVFVSYGATYWED